MAKEKGGQCIWSMAQGERSGFKQECLDDKETRKKKGGTQQQTSTSICGLIRTYISACYCTIIRREHATRPAVNKGRSLGMLVEI